MTSNTGHSSSRLASLVIAGAVLATLFNVTAKAENLYTQDATAERLVLLDRDSVRKPGPTFLVDWWEINSTPEGSGGIYFQQTKMVMEVDCEGSRFRLRTFSFQTIDGRVLHEERGNDNWTVSRKNSYTEDAFDIICRSKVSDFDKPFKSLDAAKKFYFDLVRSGKTGEYLERLNGYNPR